LLKPPPEAVTLLAPWNWAEGGMIPNFASANSKRCFGNSLEKYEWIKS